MVAVSPKELRQLVSRLEAGAAASRPWLYKLRVALQQLAGELTAAGGRAIAIPVDVSKAEEIRSAFARTRSAIGEVDVLLYNAGELSMSKVRFEVLGSLGGYLCPETAL